MCSFQGTFFIALTCEIVSRAHRGNKFLAHRARNGDGEIRTLDPLLARQVLSQLSYTPINLATSYSSVSSPTKYHQPIRS